ncbi:MAG: regulatory iron-sulfur-containing complex subunit RicT [Deltaproteobacteria bacterium]|jgi:cell fate regulator YaaT (PSP1 superfamily)|nr:regulatory iron-sulfur-containing complex subunit RicT [Deltaproteobacteria bacterium]
MKSDKNNRNSCKDKQKKSCHSRSSDKKKKHGSQKKYNKSAPVKRNKRNFLNSSKSLNFEVTIDGNRYSSEHSTEKVEIVNYGHDDSTGQFEKLPLEKIESYQFPKSYTDVDPWGDDLYSNYHSKTRPEGKTRLDIWTLLVWGIPRKVSWFPQCDTVYEKGDKIIVDTEKGIFIGSALQRSEYKTWSQKKLPRKFLRPATDKDIEIEKKHRILEREADLFARQKIEKYGLEMKLFHVHMLHTADKLLFYFTSDHRVDFRKLVRTLASRFSVRIEMRQMGVRDDSKVCGGIGVCGRSLCCACHLHKFVPVSIRMAKKQNLVLNPQNVSGQCGRLKCCLSYEYEFYKKHSRNYPREGKSINTPKGRGRVIESNILKEIIKVRLKDGDKETITFTVDEYQDFRSKNQKEKKSDPKNKTNKKPNNNNNNNNRS